ncbi:hypothetical protein FGSG_09288 [Fusarium graminearum PH-1]|nr:hypothetical protein FGSG_09288 [Fusarium graminearum PH-1]ESU15839.1 hypothetical protein FGSG_09288 [Fusarium graminearum PH-1]|eukprot:XP_011328477.1 hypothetical protein FGSG_09288 [Fusarium graminearum PH-1]
MSTKTTWGTSSATSGYPPPKPTCFRYTLVENPPSPDKCGNTGLDRGKKATVLGNGDTDSVEACGESCGQKKGCKAVVYGYKESDYNRPYCKLLDGPQVRDAGDDTAWRWYDMSCFNPDCVAPPGYECGY